MLIQFLKKSDEFFFISWIHSGYYPYIAEALDETMCPNGQGARFDANPKPFFIHKTRLNTEE